MYHFPLLYVVLFTRWRLGLPEDGIFDAILYTATIGGTLLLAFISYRWFEMPFLNLKAKFAVIESRR